MEDQGTHSCAMEPRWAERLACRFCCRRNTRINTTCPIGLEMIWCEDCSAISVVNPRTTVEYNYEYVHSRYDCYETTPAMSDLRISIIHSLLNLYEVISNGDRHLKGSLLDVGYGNGSFIRKAIDYDWDAFGHDVNRAGYPGVRRVELPRWYETKEDFGYKESYRVITFFDSLEHFESLEPLRCLSGLTDWIIVSAPLPPKWVLDGPDYRDLKEWKHFRPGEHHHYFTENALLSFWNNGYGSAQVAYLATPEDQIRGKLPDGSDNIFTIALKCQPHVFPAAEKDTP